MNGLIPERFSPSLRSSRYMILYLCPNSLYFSESQIFNYKEIQFGQEHCTKANLYVSQYI